MTINLSCAQTKDELLGKACIENDKWINDGGQYMLKEVYVAYCKMKNAAKL